MNKNGGKNWRKNLREKKVPEKLEEKLEGNNWRRASGGWIFVTCIICCYLFFILFLDFSWESRWPADPLKRYPGPFQRAFGKHFGAMGAPDTLLGSLFGHFVFM